jgi:hypothetical protein
MTWPEVRKGRYEWRPYDGLVLGCFAAINDDLTIAWCRVSSVAINGDPTMTVIVSFAINDERILPS